jgi:hypothetical protein
LSICWSFCKRYCKMLGSTINKFWRSLPQHVKRLASPNYINFNGIISGSFIKVIRDSYYIRSELRILSNFTFPLSHHPFYLAKWKRLKACKPNFVTFCVLCLSFLRCPVLCWLVSVIAEWRSTEFYWIDSDRPNIWSEKNIPQSHFTITYTRTTWNNLRPMSVLLGERPVNCVDVNQGSEIHYCTVSIKVNSDNLTTHVFWTSPCTPYALTTHNMSIRWCIVATLTSSLYRFLHLSLLLRKHISYIKG